MRNARRPHSGRVLAIALRVLASLVLTGSLGASPGWAGEDWRPWRMPGDPLPGQPLPGGVQTHLESTPQELMFAKRLPEAVHAAPVYSLGTLPPALLHALPARRDEPAQLLAAIDAEGYYWKGPFSLDLRRADVAVFLFSDRTAGGPGLCPSAEAAAGQGRDWTVELAADAHALWSDVRVLLIGMAKTQWWHCRRLASRLYIRVEGDQAHRDRRMEMTLALRSEDELGAAAAEAFDFTALLHDDVPGDVDGWGGESVPLLTVVGPANGAVRVALGSREFILPGQLATEESGFVATANHTWRALLEPLRQVAAGRAHAVVRLDQAERVPWAYVVTLLDLLRAVGVSKVVLPTRRHDHLWHFLPPVGDGRRVGESRWDLFLHLPYVSDGYRQMVLEFDPLPTGLSLGTATAEPVDCPVGIPWERYLPWAGLAVTLAIWGLRRRIVRGP